MKFPGKHKEWRKSGLLFILIVFILVFIPRADKSFPDNTDSGRHQSELTASGISSVVNSGIDLSTLQRITSAQKRCFHLIYHSINPEWENRIAESKIRLSFLPEINRVNPALLVFHYHFCFHDNDDIPHLV